MEIAVCRTPEKEIGKEGGAVRQTLPQMIMGSVIRELARS